MSQKHSILSHFITKSLVSLLLLPTLTAADQAPVDSLQAITQTIRAIGQMEGRSDPKCHATASRLEDFMYGTPLNETGRIEKQELQKNTAQYLWYKASLLATEQKAKSVEVKHLRESTGQMLKITKLDNNDWLVAGKPGFRGRITARDYRQYASIAYSLRAILSIQQEQGLLQDSPLIPLSDAALTELQESTTLISLAALQQADINARVTNQHEINPQMIKSAWASILSMPTDPRKNFIKPEKTNLDTIQQIIAQKLKSYEKYNKITTPVFLRNIQVYFARHRWPTDPEQSKQLKIAFNESIISFSKNLLRLSEEYAKRDQHIFLKPEDVTKAVAIYAPHKVNEYEDVTFFPKLEKSKQYQIESYDMDAFRDSGLHWRYLDAALNDLKEQLTLEPDPFAAELLVENIAQFGVLLLRVSGLEAKNTTDDQLNTAHMESAIDKIELLLNQHVAIRTAPNQETALVSSKETATPIDNGLTFFTDVTETSNVNFLHDSADWLNRFIRSYSIRNKNIAVLAVPPAFGGSGIAADDIDNDGKHDLLILSGKGNRLYHNEGNGKFTDITQSSGIKWVREEDGLPGESRQPVIADFNNDGLKDILITYVKNDHRMYQNIGQNRFIDVTDIASLGGKDLVGGPATAFDYDNDGLLDIYVANFGLYTDGVGPTLARFNTNGLANQLFKNMGNFKFKDVSNNSGTANTGWGQALTHTDFDRDGLQDLIVGNDFGVNAYLKNLGQGKFENIASNLGTDKPSYTMGIGLADLNADLYPDIYISNIVTMDKDQKYVSPSKETPLKLDAATLSQMRVVEANDLFISNSAADTSLVDYKASNKVGRGLSSTGWAWGAQFLDHDNDGDDDLYVLNGMNDFALYATENPYYKDPAGKVRDIFLPDSKKDTNVFFANANGMLNNASTDSGLNRLSNARAAVYLDIDNDGDLDMVVNNYHEKAVVYQNNAEQRKNNWIKVTLTGNPEAKINKDAIGTRIIAKYGENQQSWREIRGSGAYLTSFPKQQHIGLGKADSVDLTIEWPNGKVSQHTGLKANQSYSFAP